MQSKTRAAAPGNKAETRDQEEKTRLQLQRIVHSKAFRAVDRLQRFLSYIVEETLAGRGDSLKEYPIGVEVFEKDSSFDPRMDPIVRVQARRLRMRLTSYYQEEGQTDAVIIELPKGGYAPTFRRLEVIPTRKHWSPALVSRNTVAVVPFENHSTSEEVGQFARGIAQEIIHTLSNLDSIVVVSRNPVHTPRETEESPAAAMIVGGAVRLMEGTLRITTHIVDTIRGCYVWSASLDTKSPYDFATQEQVARAASKALTEELFDGKTRSSRHGYKENLAAHNMHLQGRYYLNQRTEKGLRKALDFFEQALAEDPKFAAAYAGLADAHSLLAHYGIAAPAEVWTKTAANASQAVLVDDESSEAHASLGHVKATQDWDWAGAEREFQRAISLDPRNAIAHHWYAVSCLAPLGKLDQALEEVLLAQALDPVSSIIARDIAVVYYYKRNFELALEQCDHTIEQNPHFFAAYWTLALVQEQRGDFDESAAAFRRAIDLSPRSPRILGGLARTFAKQGKRAEALEILHELDELSKQRYISPIELALTYFALKQTDEGFEFLTKAFQDRCFELSTIRLDPRFDAVRQDARFAELFQKLNLPEF